MKIGRFFGTLVSFLLLLSFIRAVNGAPFVGVSDVLVRLSSFEFDLKPFNDLVSVWKKSYAKSIVDTTEISGFWDFIENAIYAVFHKLKFLGDAISILWDKGLSLFSVPVQFFIQLWDFVLWLLGFTV